MKGERKGLMTGGPEGDRRRRTTDEFSREAGVLDSRKFVSPEELDVRLAVMGRERDGRFDTDRSFPGVGGWRPRRIQRRQT